MTDNRPLDRPLAAFFLLAFGWTWGLAALFLFAPGWVERTIGPVGPQSPLFFIAVYGPSLAAIVVTAFTSGRPGVAALLRRLVQWKFSPLWYGLVLVGVPLLATLTGHFGAIMMGIESAPHIARIPAFITALPVALFLDPGPLGEELGWRGFALPRMTQRWGAPLAAILLGLIWGVWHYPVFQIPSMNQSSLSFPVFVVGTIVMSVVIAWLVMRTGGSVLIAVLFHLAVNLSLAVFQPPFPLFVVVLGVVAAAILAFDTRFRTSRSVESVVT